MTNAAQGDPRVLEALAGLLRPFYQTFGPLGQAVRQDPVSALIPNPAAQIRQSAAQVGQALSGPKPDYLAALMPLVAGGASVGMIGPERQIPGPAGAFYHGSPKPPGPLTDAYYSGRNIYGEGLYSTDNSAVAGSYVRKGARKLGEQTSPTVSRVVEKVPVKMYDLNGPLSGAAMKGIESASRWSQSAEDALSMIHSGEVKTLAEAIDHMRQMSPEYGESADHVVEAIDVIKAALEGEGYGGFTHVGGKFVGKTPHQVKIYWYPHEQVSLK
jgi:hypothetical protein